ncbi:MAG: hypothetical protein DDT20_00717 [Firmicutes bacterium]|nr:hypothetical protein [Bacillota bacterium]
MTAKRWLWASYAVALILLLVLPHAIGVMTRELIGRIFILAVFGMSYDILRGYTGIINLGHAAFFGGGTYIAGIMFTRLGTSASASLLAVALAWAFAVILALVMGQFAFRNTGAGGVLACAMITLAFGEIVRHTAETFRQFTQGADGLTFAVPVIFRDRIGMYYYALLFLVVMTLLLRQFINSPAGRVLQAIRDNEQRARFLGYDVRKYKLLALVTAALAASSAGFMFALLTRFANTDLLSVQNTLNALLFTIVGGTGTLYGAIVGTAFVQLVQSYLLELRGIHEIFARWQIFFGAIYVLVVLYMPLGMVGAFLRIKGSLAYWRTSGGNHTRAGD